jgi:hypothetical protein
MRHNTCIDCSRIIQIYSTLLNNMRDQKVKTPRLYWCTNIKNECFTALYNKMAADTEHLDRYKY